MIKAITAEARLRARYGRLPDALTAVDISQRYGGYGDEILEALRVDLLDQAIASLDQGNEPFGPPMGRDRAAAKETGATNTYETGDARVAPAPMPRRRSAKLDKKALALAAQLVDQVSDLPAGEANDRIRIDLAAQVSALGAPHLAPLAIDDSLAARSERAAATRAAAAEAAALIDPLGALGSGADALSGAPAPSAVDGLLSELEAAEFEALRRMTAPAGDSDAKGDESGAQLAKLRAAKGAVPQPAGTIEDGQFLLQGVQEDLKLLRALASEQKAAPAPQTAPPVGGATTEGGVDG